MTTDGVKDVQDLAQPEKTEPSESSKGPSDKELNFRRLELEREKEREARIRAESRTESMERELREIKTMLTPKEKDPLDDVDEYVDKDRLRAIREQDRARFQKEAKAIARQEIQEAQQDFKVQSQLERLRSQPDFHKLMTAENLIQLERLDPVFAETVLEIPDEYKRLSKAYKKLKSIHEAKVAEKPSIRDKVEENQNNPYYTQTNQSTPPLGAIDFDVRSPEARAKAYAELRANIRRPIA